MAEQYDPITGNYREVDVEKSNNPRWPSLSGDHKTESVEKDASGSPWPSFSGDAEEDDDSDEEFEKRVPIFPIEKKGDKHICCGIVYEPDTEDAQGDQASAEEIEKAAHDFMQNAQQFKVMHKGKAAKIKVLESYIAPNDLTIGKRKVKKGSWVLVTKILDEKVWQLIKACKLTGYSMAGYAKVE